MSRSVQVKGFVLRVFNRLCVWEIVVINHCKIGGFIRSIFFCGKQPGRVGKLVKVSLNLLENVRFSVCNTFPRRAFFSLYHRQQSENRHGSAG